MLINYLQTAKYPKRTHEKGYWSNPENTQWDETVEFSIGLKKRDREKYSIIIDLDQKQILKNNMSREREFDVLYGYYRVHYENQIDRFLTQTNHIISAQSAPTV